MGLKAARRMLGVLTALSALVFRALIPDGYMLAGAGDAGTGPLLLCPARSAELVEALGAPRHHHHATHDTDEAGSVSSECPYALALTGALPPETGAPMPLPAASAPPATMRVARVAAPLALPPPATGPPVLL